MGKIIRRVIAVLLTATGIVLAVLPAGSAEATSTHGDYEYDGATVVKYLGTDTEVTLPAWVNRVGKEAFENYDPMTKLVLTDTVTTVDFGAFSNCDNLSTVRMGESVRTLGSAAFSGCTSLYSVSVPRTVRTIGSGTFAGCTSLANVPVDADNKNYTSYDGAIYTKNGKKLVQYLAGRPSTTYRMPRSVREIEEYAFWGANNLSKLSITPGVTEIPEYAFSNCRGLKHVTLPGTVQSIFAYAFENCDSLSYINIPDSVGYIDDRAFSNTKGALLRFVDSSGNVVKTFNSDDVDQYGSGTGGSSSIEKPDYSGAAAEDAAEQAYKTSKSTDNKDNAGDTGTNNSSGNTSGSDTPGASGNSGAGGDTSGNTGSTGDNNNGSDNGSNNGSNSGSGSNTSIVNSNGRTTYYEDGTPDDTPFDPTDVTPLDEGDTPDTGGNAQSGGAAAEDPNSPAPSNIIDAAHPYNNGYYKASDSGSDPWDTQIEYRDYENNMNSYDLGAGKIIGGVAVLRMSSDIPVKGFNFDNAEYEDTYTETAGQPERVSDSDVLGNVYAAYSGEDPYVTIPPGVSRIGDRAFYKNTELTGVDLPSSVTDIGEFAFARSALAGVDIPQGVRSIDYAAFYMCPNLTDVNIPDSVSSIALGAFSGTPFLENFRTQGGDDYLVVGDGVLLSYKGRDKKIIIPENVKHIGPAAFAKNNNLESVVIPNTVADIGEEAFSGCSNLKELVMAEGVRSISDRAFKNSALSVVSIPDSVQSIGLSAFDNGGKLKTVIFKGDDVPNVSYEKSATRLSARDLRTDAFEGAENAIVESDCDLDSGTLFNPRFYGFSGEVYSIGPENMLVLERALSKPDAAGNVVINQMVDMAGDTYTLGQVKNNAFDTYRSWSDYYDDPPTNLSVNGEQSSELVSLLAGVNSDLQSNARPQEPEAEDGIKSNITVTTDGKRIPTRGDAYATIPGDTDKYTLSITEDDSAKNSIDAAFMHSEGTTAGDMVPLSVDLYDRSGTVPIHKLGNSKMEVSMPVPTGMEDDEGVGIACLDDNGLLTPLSSELVDGAGGKNIKFVTGHCSTYVIYSRSPRKTVIDENGNIIETVDETGAAGPGFGMGGTWQSLNKKVYGPVSAKWFIIIILMATAAILVLYKPAKKNKR